MRLALLVPLAWASCAFPGAGPPARPVPGWRLAEVETGAGRELVLEPDAAALTVEIRLSRPEAGVGESVEAEVWLPEAVGRRWVEVSPSRPGVRLLGPSSILLEEGRPAVVRFTRLTPGRGGIVVHLRD